MDVYSKLSQDSQVFGQSVSRLIGKPAVSQSASQSISQSVSESGQSVSQSVSQ